MKTLAVTVAAFIASASWAADPVIADKAAYAAVTKWLGLWDSGRLEEALDSRSELIRGMTPRDKALAAARNHQQQVGKVEQRKLVDFEPLGRDVRTMQADYASVYSKAGAQCERVSVYREDDGVWRVHTWALQPYNPEKSCSLQKR